MMWFVVILFVIITIILLTGKGGFLISGYNLASEKEKAKYDEKKLSRVMGGCTGVITIMLVYITVFHNQLSENSAWFILGFIIVDVMVTMILTSTVCKTKNEQTGILNDEKQIIKNRNIKKYSYVFTIALFCVVGVLLVTGDVTVQVK